MATIQRPTKVTVLVIALLASQLTSQPCYGQSIHALDAKFDTSTGLILVPVGINGSTFWCNLDSGFSALLTLNERLAERAALMPAPARSTPDGRPATPGDHEAIATVDVGGVVLRDRQVILRAFPSEAPEMQCVMGVGVVRDFIVEFDYDAARVRLYPREQFVATPQARVLPLDVRRNTAFVTVELQLEDGSRHPASVVVDTGASYFSVVLVKAFVERTKIASATHTARQPSAGVLKPLSARLSGISLGPFTVHGQITALLEQDISPGLDDGLLGSGFLQQFTVAIDYVGARLFLTPNKRFGVPQPFDAGGVAFRPPDGRAGVEVAFVVSDTVAARADLRPGDRLLRVNGSAVETMTPIELREMMSRPGLTVRLDLSRAGQVFTRILTLEDRLR